MFPEVVSVFQEAPQIIPVVVVDDVGADVGIDSGVVLSEKKLTNVGCCINCPICDDSFHSTSFGVI